MRTGQSLFLIQAGKRGFRYLVTTLRTVEGKGSVGGRDAAGTLR